MIRTEIEAEIADLHAKATLLASEQRRLDYLDQRLVEVDVDDGLESVRALQREWMAREVAPGFANDDDERGASWRP